MDETFYSIYNLYYPKVRSFLLRLSGSEWVADDCTQNVFTKIWIHKADLKLCEGNLNGYIFMIARNEITDYFRSRKKILAFQENFAKEMGKETSLDEKVDAEELTGIINRIVESMPSSRKEIFILSRFKNFTNDEIAKMRNLSKRTVEKHISNAISQVKMELKTYII